MALLFTPDFVISKVIYFMKNEVLPQLDFSYFDNINCMKWNMAKGENRLKVWDY